MSRDPKKILQVSSPTDFSLKKLILKLFEDESISSVNIKNGILPPKSIEGIREIESESEDEDTIEQRSLEDVKVDVEATFENTTATSSSINYIEFHGFTGKFCTFERVRTMPMQMLNNHRSTIQYVSSPDYRVAEFYFDKDNLSDAEDFNTAISVFLRPTVGDDSDSIGIDTLNSVLSRMTSVSAGMIEDLSKSQLEQEKRMSSLMEKQALEFEAQKTKLNDVHQKNLESLEQRSKELDAREEEMDNATTRSTRRKLRGAITEALKENQKAEIIPESARKVRAPILLLAGIGILASLFFSSWAFWQFSSIPEGLTEASLNWYLGSLLLRGSLGIFASIAIGLYLLRYLRSIEADAGRRALALEQNLFDIDRASWVVETVMELKEEEGMTSVPGPWLEGVTRGLFQHTKEDDSERGPVDALIGLMGSGMALKLNNGDNEVSFDSKASKSAAKMQKKNSG